MPLESFLQKSCAIVLNKGASRCLNASKNVPLCLKSHYCSEFLKEVYSQKYIININESGFGNAIKENYSWLPRGIPSTIINSVFTGRVNLILGISLAGDYLGLISNKSINSSDYCLFLAILSEALKTRDIEIQDDITLVQD